MLNRKNHKRILFTILLLCLTIIVLSALVSAEPRNLTVAIYGPERYADIWLGISTGGYEVIAEQGKEMQFRVFVKNGMTDRSLHNFKIIPNNFPFVITSIKPKQIDQIKPMEIVIFWVNASIPEDAEVGRHRYTFEVSSDEFPTGIFRLEDDLRVVDRIRTELYALYAFLSVLILAILFYRKWTIEKQGRQRSKKH